MTRFHRTYNNKWKHCLKSINSLQNMRQWDHKVNEMISWQCVVGGNMVVSRDHGPQRVFLQWHRAFSWNIRWLRGGCARSRLCSAVSGRVRRRSAPRTDVRTATSCVRRYSAPTSLRPATTLRTLPLLTLPSNCYLNIVPRRLAFSERPPRIIAKTYIFNTIHRN